MAADPRSRPLAPNEQARGARRPRPPAQPTRGPGGADYRHAGFRQHLVGDGPRACWVFTPTGPTPARASVVMFFHGLWGLNPLNYGAWIVHLVRRGHVVLYPVYQERPATAHPTPAPFPALLGNAAAGARAALSEVATQGLCLDRPVAYVGHSLGAVMAGVAAGQATELGLPRPHALMLVQPGWGPRWVTTLEPLRRVDPTTDVVVMVGDADHHVPAQQPQIVYRALGAIPAARRRFVVLRSDRHGWPPLVADHSAPLAEHPGVGPPLPAVDAVRRRLELAALGLRCGPPNALDFFGHWKLLDLLIDGSGDRDVDPSVEHFMGRWSDGMPVRELLVVREADRD